MAEKKNISDKLKLGVQDLLLGDKTVIHGCTVEVDGLTANHLVVTQAGTTPTNLIEYIDRRIQQFIDLKHNTSPVVSMDNRPIPVIYGA